MSAPTRTIETISFGPNGIHIAFMSSTDVRAEGAVFQSHNINIAWGTEELRALMEELEQAADALLAEAVPFWAGSKPVDLQAEREAALADNDDDNDEGLGS